MTLASVFAGTKPIASNNGLRILMRVPQATIDELNQPEKGIDFLYLDKFKPWFAEGWLDINAPRAMPVTESLIAAVLEFGVWADGQGMLRTFGNLDEAEKAARGAQVKLAVDFDLPVSAEAEQPELEQPEAEPEPPTEPDNGADEAPAS